ncbi:cold shock domain-containing protein [Vibrio tasmaniensis]|uniref:cold shock domain-containing protein n=1 Tax=Vibrio tasmaniensis TaxID=212663 RepID=UPI001119F4F4|nr:cold shock domain-containing protein [Vibrio tasmaniensis]
MNGKIVRWVDDRGFGFINSDELKGDVFVHISKFRKGYRSPKVGDKVEFQLSHSTSKLSASSAQLVGIDPLKSNPLSLILSAFIVGLIGAALYLFLLEPKLNPAYESMGFSCQGKMYCSEMLSCDEAKFYLDNCSDVKIDGDRDGTPCESQHCSRW